jgi:hypothetical protein
MSTLAKNRLVAYRARVALEKKVHIAKIDMDILVRSLDSAKLKEENCNILLNQEECGKKGHKFKDSSGSNNFGRDEISKTCTKCRLEVPGR